MTEDRNKTIEYNPSNWIYMGLFIGCMVCCWTVLRNGYVTGAIVASFPFILLAGAYLLKKPIVSLFLFFIINYFIMGANRYNLVPVPLSAIIDSLLGFILITVILKSSFYPVDWKPSRNFFLWVSLIWFLYCLIQIFNTTSGQINIGAWYQGVRGMAIYPLITAILIPLIMKSKKHIQWFLILWAFLTMLGAAKGYWQRNRGFDPTELYWLFTYGGRTHLIATGIRYFSFFSDANNFGASMGFSLVVFSISALYTKNLYLKIFYLIAAFAGGYGMMISGTRGALAVPLAGYALFIIISKSWKMMAGGLVFLALAVSFLVFTDIGNGNIFIRRMRTAFDANDASLQVRFINRKKLSEDMSQIPMGLGIGMNSTTFRPENRFYETAQIPPDSWYVTIWTRTGIIGLIIYISVLASTIIYGSYLLFFKVKNKELKGVLAGMLSGVFGMMAAAYGGDCYTQFPNGFLVFTCQTLVMISPYIDKELTLQKEQKKEIENQNLRIETNGETTA